MPLYLACKIDWGSTAYDNFNPIGLITSRSTARSRLFEDYIYNYVLTVFKLYGVNNQGNASKRLSLLALRNYPVYYYADSRCNIVHASNTMMQWR